MDREMMEISHKIGALESRANSLESRIDGLETRINEQLEGLEENIGELDTKLDEIINTLSQVKGGWKVLAWVGAAFVALLTFGGWIFDRMQSISAIFRS